MVQHFQQRRDGSASAFSRACAVLCLLLLCFSVGHTVLGHSDFAASPGLYDAHHSQTSQIGSQPADTQDACALCVAMASAAPLDVYSVAIPETAKPRYPEPVAMDGPVTGWHASLSCRPPPQA